MTDGGVPPVVDLLGFRLDRRKLRLTGPDGTAIRLRPREFRTLAYLATHPGEIVAKRALLDAVWPNVVVEENNLNQAISALRRVLGDSLDDPRFIVTEQGRGYRLIAPVRAVDDDEPVGAADADDPAGAADTNDPVGAVGADDPVGAADASGPVGAVGADDPANTLHAHQPDDTPACVGRTPPPRAKILSLAVRFGEGGRPALRIGAAAAALALLVAAAIALVPRPDPPAALATVARQPTLAVLPFSDGSAQREQEPYGDRLSDALRDRLSAVEGLIVTGRLSSHALGDRSRHVRDIGAALGVAFVLDGSVVLAGDRLRVTAELTDTADGYRLWAESYDRALGEAADIESDIAWRAAGAIGARLDPARRPEWATDDAEAYALAIRGWHLLAGSSTPESVFAAGQLFRAATVRDPDYVFAWSGLQQSLVTTAFLFPERGESTRSELDLVAARLAALDSAWSARMRFEQAMADDDLLAAREAFEASRGVVPADVIAWFGWRLDLKAGRPRAVLDAVREESRRNPASVLASARLHAVLYAVGHADAAEAEYLRGRALEGSPVERAALEGTALFRALKEGYERDSVLERLDRFRAALPAAEHGVLDAAATLDQPEAALAALRRALRSDLVWPQGIAWWADYFGDTELALEALRLSPPLEDWGLFTPMLENTRRDPRFKDLLRERGYLEYWRATGEWSDFCRPVGDDDFECR